MPGGFLGEALRHGNRSESRLTFASSITQSIHLVSPMPRVPRMGSDTRRPLDPTRLYSTLVERMDLMSGSGTALDVNTEGAGVGLVAAAAQLDSLDSLGGV